MNNKSKEVVIVSAIRTPIGIYRGSIKNIKSHQLGSIVIKEVLKRSKFSKDEMEKWIPFFDSHQKKDDIGDTFLMAINLIYGIPKKQARNKKGNCIK